MPTKTTPAGGGFTAIMQPFNLYLNLLLYISLSLYFTMKKWRYVQYFL